MRLDIEFADGRAAATAGDSRVASVAPRKPRVRRSGPPPGQGSLF
jgi:hypothetical protein